MPKIDLTRDKFGRRYGFVRFLHANSVHELLMELKTIWVGTYKLIVDPARDRGWERNPCKPSSRGEKKDSARRERSRNLQPGSIKVRGQKLSYADVV
ncbi:hypothetical protein Ancab_003120 [Ancistrocladus abbreviatus]